MKPPGRTLNESEWIEVISEGRGPDLMRERHCRLAERGVHLDDVLALLPCLLPFAPLLIPC